MPFDYDRIKDILVCPECKGDLVLDGEALVCASPELRLSYPIIDDIPRLLADEAVPLSPADWAAVMQRHGRDPATGQPQG